METRVSRRAAFISKAERRKAQNRVNQRAGRRRRRDAAEPQGDQRAPQGEVSESHKLLQTLLADPSGSNDMPNVVDKKRLQALSITLFSSLRLDHAQVLSPLLADPRLRKVWSTAVNVLWPPLDYNDQWGGGKRDLTASFLRSGLGDPLLFHAQTCTNSVAIAMRDDESNAIRNMALYHETQAVKLLRHEISEAGSSPRDELLLAMLLLSSRSGQDVPVITERKQIGAFRPPLTNLHHLVVGSSIHFGNVHRDMLKRLVVQKGGVGDMVMPFLGEFFNTMDLFQASTRCEKPDFGLCRSYLACLQSDVLLVRQRHRDRTRIPFRFPTAFLEESFQDLLWDVRCYLEMVQAHHIQAWPEPPYVPLALHRNLIQHRILSIEPHRSNAIRELCRVALLLFSCVVVYPLQNMEPMRRYLNELTHLLRIANNIEEDFRLWVLFLGAMAADQTPLQLWYLSELKPTASGYGQEWSHVKEALQNFLWLDSACGEGALEVWHRIMVMSY